MENLALYLQPLIFSFLLSLVFIKAIILFSQRYKIFDSKGGRKTHSGEISRLGGLGIIAAFWLAIFLSGSLVFDKIKIALFVCSLCIFVFGLWDDIRNLSWKKQILFQILIALGMIYFGLQVDYIANPFGGREFRLDLFTIFGFSVLGSIFVTLWIVGFMNVVNWLDGMDGLAGGVGAIAALTLFVLSIGATVNQPPLAVLAISLVGALLGFLVYNSHPAKIFMGSSGALFLGFMLASLAVFAGGKIATVFLVMGFPILDAVWVVIKRIYQGKSPFAGDRSHFQYNLLDRGWSQRETVFFIYLLCAIFGLAALLFQGVYKLFALGVLFLGVLLVMLKLKFGKKIVAGKR